MKLTQAILLIFIALFLTMCGGGDQGKDTDALSGSDASSDTAVADVPQDTGKVTTKDTSQGGEDASGSEDADRDVPVDMSFDVGFDFGIDVPEDALPEVSTDVSHDLVSMLRVYGTISRTDPVKNLNPFGSNASDFTGTLYVGICEGNPITTEALTGDIIENVDMTDPTTKIDYAITGEIPEGHYWIGVYLDTNENGEVDSKDLIVETSPQIDLPATGAVKVDAVINKMIP